MIRLKFIVIILCLSITIHAQEEVADLIPMTYKGSSIFSKWVFSIDAPLQLPIFTTQNNFFDEKLVIHENRISTLGLELMKYFPNRKISFGGSIRYSYNSKVFNNNPIITIEENNVVVDLNFRRLLSKTKPYFLDIHSLFLGGGLSINYGFNPQLDSNFGNQTIEYNFLVNKLKVYGLFSFGFIENLFNNSKRTTISKLQFDIGVPLLSLASHLTNNYQNLSPEIDFLQKSKGNNYFVGIKYTQFIDMGKNRFPFSHQLEDEWTDMTDPIKDYLPEIVKVNKPRRNYYGNFRYSFELYNNLDSTLIRNTTNYIRNKSFTSFEFGYSFHFFGNHAKPYDKVVSNDSKRRYDIFLSANLRNSYLSLTDNKKNSKYYNLSSKFYAGGQVIFENINLNFAGGIGYVVPIYSSLYSSEVNSINLSKQKSSFFFSVGFSNFNIRIETLTNNFQIFNLDDVKEDFSVNFQIGI